MLCSDENIQPFALKQSLALIGCVNVDSLQFVTFCM